MDLDEPRRPRLTTSHPATYRPHDDAAVGAMPVVGEVMDISEGGFRLRTSQQLEVGAAIDLEIAVGGELFFARGRVVRVSRADDGRFECGLRWNGIPTETLYALLYSTP